MAIIAAVDSSDRAIAVVERASELSREYGVALHVVHVAEPTVDFREELIDVSADALNPEVGEVPEQRLDDLRTEAAETAAAAAADVDDLEAYEAVGLVGNPATAIKQYASEHDAEYIVVSGRKRHPLGQALFGSVTQALLLNANRPVVAVPHDRADS